MNNVAADCTWLAEQLDPDVWHRILERFFEVLTDGIHRFEGTVNQYTGDGIMAGFGAPLTHSSVKVRELDDHADHPVLVQLQLNPAAGEGAMRGRDAPSSLRNRPKSLRRRRPVRSKR